MSKAPTSKFLWMGIAGLSLSPMVCAQTTATPEGGQVVLSDPCAVFNMPTPDPAVTRIVYGEDINFDLKAENAAFIDVGEDGRVRLGLELSTHGNGIGQTSGIKYVFNSRVLLSGANGGYDPLGPDPMDPDFVFSSKVRLDARIIGQGHAASQDGIAQGAQDNARLFFTVNVRYADGKVVSTTSDFTLECVASPWANLMKQPDAMARKAVGRGFGDPWNKYAWSMKDFGGGMVVGTKNAYYDFQSYDPEMDCGYMVTDIHLPIACMELYQAPNSGTSPAAADTRFAEIWRFDYVKKTWAKVFDDRDSQGFRIMETHNGKLYAGSDLGAFITGVDLYTGTPGAWNFPGSQLLVSVDGKNFTRIASCETGGPCNHATGVANPYGIVSFSPYPVAVNTSIRALASYNDKLYVGTFNAIGAELWAYNDISNTWSMVHKFINPMLPKAAIAELRVYKGKLYIGLAGPAGDSYLYRYDGATIERVPNQPMLAQSNVGALKLFTSSDGLLYVGNVDLTLGFYLQVYDGTSFRTITANGFYNPNNAYAWSMAEVNGRVFVGTFNQDMDMLAGLPRGISELWYSDDSTTWQQMALPLDWGLWNYGIRNMETGNSNKLLFLGSASNMVAPDLVTRPVPLGPGTEVWTIRATAVAPTGNSNR